METEQQVTSEDLAGAFESFKELNDKAIEERKALGEASSETRERLEKTETSLDELYLKLERIQKVPAPKSDNDYTEKEVAHNAAFSTYIRKGERALSPDEHKALTIQDDTTGGYLASPEVTSELLRNMVEISPIRQIARVRTASQRSVKIRKRTSSSSASWTAEGASQSEATNPNYGLEEIYAHQLTAYHDISFEDLEDSDFNLEAELRLEFAEQFAKAEGLAFVTGNGVGRPAGLMVNGDVTSVNSGHATLLTGDGLVELFYEPITGYRGSSSWIMNRKTIRDIRRLKDGNGNYIWEPAFGGEPPSILGAPYLEVPDVADIGAGAEPVAFGDFRQAYYIVDRLALSVVRDDLTQAASGNVRFLARKRVGGQVVLAEAYKLQTVSA